MWISPSALYTRPRLCKARVWFVGRFGEGSRSRTHCSSEHTCLRRRNRDPPAARSGIDRRPRAKPPLVLWARNPPPEIPVCCRLRAASGGNRITTGMRRTCPTGERGHTDLSAGGQGVFFFSWSNTGNIDLAFAWSTSRDRSTMKPNQRWLSLVRSPPL